MFSELSEVGLKGIHLRSILAARLWLGPLALFGLLLFPVSRADAGAYSAIIIDARTGETVYSRHADSRRYPASLTKIMTLYMTFEALESGHLKLGQHIRVSKRAAGQTPSKLGLKAGSTITVQNAILAVVTKSANDAATVLAEAISGTEVKFSIEMTKRAARLGMVQTRFTNASGLPNRRQRTTARDMSTLALSLLNDYPGYYSIFSTREFSFAGRTHNNHNNLLDSYQGTDGIKTGYIRASGFNLVASVKRGDRQLIGVVFGGRSPTSRDKHLVELFDKVFATPASTLVVHLPIAKPGSRPNVAVAVAAPPPVPVAQPAKTKPIAVATRATKYPAATIPAVTAALQEETRDPLALAALARRDEADAVAINLWSVQVGAFLELSAAQAELNRAARVEPALFIRTDPVITEVKVEGRILYRARLVGLSEERARETCRTLWRQQMSCVAVAVSQGDTPD